jgi:hypothetical protein
MKKAFGTDWLCSEAVFSVFALLALAATSPGQIARNEPIQSLPNSQPTQAAQAEPTPPSVSSLKKVVAFLSLDVRDGLNKAQVRGTAFFVLYEDKRIGENGGFLYLVTNRHVAEPGEDGRRFVVDRFSIRLNLKTPVNDRQSEEGDLPVGKQVRWYFPGSILL